MEIRNKEYMNHMSNPFIVSGRLEAIFATLMGFYFLYLAGSMLWVGLEPGFRLVGDVVGLLVVFSFASALAASAWWKLNDWRVSNVAPADLAQRSLGAMISTGDPRSDEPKAYSANALKELLNKSEITPLAGAPSGIFDFFVGHDARAHPYVEALVTRMVKAVVGSIAVIVLISVLVAILLPDTDSLSANLMTSLALLIGFLIALRQWTYRRLITPLGTNSTLRRFKTVVLLAVLIAAVAIVGQLHESLDPHLESALSLAPISMSVADYTLPMVVLLICSALAGIACASIIKRRRGLLDGVVENRHSSRDFSLTIEKSASAVLWVMQREIWGQDTPEGDRRILQGHENLEDKSLEGGRDSGFVLAETSPVFRPELTDQIAGGLLAGVTSLVGHLLMFSGLFCLVGVANGIGEIVSAHGVASRVTAETPLFVVGLTLVNFGSLMRGMSDVLSSECIFESSLVRIVIKSETNRQLAPTITQHATEVRKESLSDMSIKAEALRLISSTLAGRRRGNECCLSYPRYIIACGADFELTSRLERAALFAQDQGPMTPVIDGGPQLIE